jgi:uncharacterized protein
MEIGKKERAQLLGIARGAIKARLQGGRMDVSGYPALMEKSGVFVTLKKKGELRGCIGYPLPVKPLAEAVRDNAENAAFEDPRFMPLDDEEFDLLEIEITVLSVPKPVEFSSPADLLKKVKVGRDGIIIEYGYYAGLLLPQVPVEEKWNAKDYLNHACNKAGLPFDAWERLPIKVKLFQGTVFGEKS